MKNGTSGKSHTKHHKDETVLEKAKELEEGIVETTEKVTEELQIAIPEKKDVPVGMRLIILTLLLAGIAILGNVFAENYTFQVVDLSSYFLRIVMGAFLVFIAYTLHKKMLLGLWLFGISALIAMASNPIIGIFPVIALIYLYQHKSRLKVARKFKLGNIKFEI